MGNPSTSGPLDRPSPVRLGGVLLAAVAFACALAPSSADEAAPATETPVPDAVDFLRIASPDEAETLAAMERIAAGWRDGYAAMVLDVARFFRPPAARRTSAAGGTARPGTEAGAFDGAGVATVDGGSPIRRRLIRFLEQRTGRRLGDDLDDWRRWLWSLPYDPHPDYAAFKGGVYANVDRRFRELLPPGVASDIRLDQIDWGGVGVDGIPPLVDPDVHTADEATWLKDKHVVFGVVVDGQARAYPKRILAWHELARDRLGGRTIALVYCTLCGAAIPYDASVGGRTYTFGTSGLLYRSNKLMFDAETGSLWSAMTGRPLVGPLAGSDVRLAKLPVVTTTWGAWRARYPATTVLSIDTGHDRDYREGAAYREYFRSPRPMFAVPTEDDRLRPKDEVLVLDTLRDADGAVAAVDVRALRKGTALVRAHGGRTVVLLTDRSGATRAYDVGDTSGELEEEGGRWRDSRGRHWHAGEDALRSEDPAVAPRARVPAHRSFWFGVVAHYPAVRLLR